MSDQISVNGTIYEATSSMEAIDGMNEWKTSPIGVVLQRIDRWESKHLTIQTVDADESQRLNDLFWKK